jgi:hypothetical protein
VFSHAVYCPLQLKPVYESVARRLAGEPNLIVASIDRTRNDFPFVLRFERYPTVFLFKSGAYALAIPSALRCVLMLWCRLHYAAQAPRMLQLTLTSSICKVRRRSSRAALCSIHGHALLQNRPILAAQVRLRRPWPRSEQQHSLCFLTPRSGISEEDLVKFVREHISGGALAK